MKKLIYWNEEKTDNVKMKKEDKSAQYWNDNLSFVVM
jgi:hypothetical protein